MAAPGITVFADPHRVEPILNDAGFTQVTATAVDVPSFVGRSAAEATDFLLDGPLRPMLDQTDAARRRHARAAVLKTLHGNETGEGVRLPAHGWLYTATRTD